MASTQLIGFSIAIATYRLSPIQNEVPEDWVRILDLQRNDELIF